MVIIGFYPHEIIVRKRSFYLHLGKAEFRQAFDEMCYLGVPGKAEAGFSSRAKALEVSIYIPQSSKSPF